MTDQENLDVKNAIDGKLSDTYDELEIVLKNLISEKEAAGDHGTFKRIDKTVDKVRIKMHRLKP
ncbi:MAG: hypothetical protein COA44_01270 [Arcobacter sp.]|nr:MAG: hypothetical protein COA44_01270 [Arcobacter sp.]